MRTSGIAYLLWFFGGLMGFHRFYCGRIGTGLLWFFTGGLAGVGWIIDLFLIPDMVRESNAEDAQMYGYPPPVPRSAMAAAAPANRVIYCPQCGGPMQVPANATGAQFACPKCRTVLQVPA